MNPLFKILGVLGFVFGAVLQLHSQGHIVPNGVVTNLFPHEIDVWNPSDGIVTGFEFLPAGKQLPTDFTNIFSYTYPVTFGVRVFLVSPNDPISLQPILSHSYNELIFPSNYVFPAGVPFYVGLYTGNNFAPPYPPFPPFYYQDPVFGWAELENVNGVIQVLDSAVEYQGGGIYVGTQDIIPIPEPGTLSLCSIFILFLCSQSTRANKIAVV